MPRTQVVIFRDANGATPLLDWFARLPEKVQDKCRVRIERIAELGYELRRPEADFLRDGIYELRVRQRNVNYRMLYFFHEQTAVVLSHGLTKERVVPAREIDLAIEHMQQFVANPKRHTATEE